MREFPFITRGRIVEELQHEGLSRFSFSQLHRFEKTGKVPVARRTGGQWRMYTRLEADKVKAFVWKWYGGKEGVTIHPEYKPRGFSDTLRIKPL
ncbi:MAG TPA: hypothetical protein DCS09_10670 [Porphyromonadaceae bacterium]|nr:hypothetical protein [Porphyromonadaceae bacterium]